MKKKSGDTGKSLSGTRPAAAFRDEMDRALGRFFSDDWMKGFPRLGGMWDFPAMPQRSGAGLPSMPTADLSEDDKQFELSVELPGMDEKELELTLAEGALVLKGEKTQEKETQEKDYHLTERSYGSVRRRFPLPPGVDVEKMDASFTRGVLKVILPKTEAARATSRKIEVRCE